MNQPGLIDGIIVPSLTLVCPYCQNTHRVPDQIPNSTIACKKCNGQMQIPSETSELKKQLANLNSFDNSLNKDVNLIENLWKLIWDQESEIKNLKLKLQKQEDQSSGFKVNSETIKDELIDLMERNLNKLKILNGQNSEKPDSSSQGNEKDQNEECLEEYDYEES